MLEILRSVVIAVIFAPAALLTLVVGGLAWYFGATQHDVLIFVAGAVFASVAYGSVVVMAGLILGGGN